MDRAATKSVTCEQAIEVLVDYLDGTMDKISFVAFEAHFADCQPCLDFLQTYKMTITVCQKTVTLDEPLPAEVQSRLRSFLKEKCSGKKPGG